MEIHFYYLFTHFPLHILLSLSELKENEDTGSIKEVIIGLTLLTIILILIIIRTRNTWFNRLGMVFMSSFLSSFCWISNNNIRSILNYNFYMIDQEYFFLLFIIGDIKEFAKLKTNNEEIEGLLAHYSPFLTGFYRRARH